MFGKSTKTFFLPLGEKIELELTVFVILIYRLIKVYYTSIL